MFSFTACWHEADNGLAVNLDVTPVEVPELVRWIDDLHKSKLFDRRLSRLPECASAAVTGSAVHQN